ncbi:hypothetical protein MB901379_03363 [Mycobacterium basiliense]|uniref:Uncharacterized protein n=1 Tax=Mycobacterium basiliense TaxID=2094119 RepID=A0A3S4BHF1_9MYCO|nr:hypothetical protein MB901379_03363 [Mycobacterium basiliense]
MAVSVVTSTLLNLLKDDVKREPVAMPNESVVLVTPHTRITPTIQVLRSLAGAVSGIAIRYKMKPAPAIAPSDMKATL